MKKLLATSCLLFLITGFFAGGTAAAAPDFRAVWVSSVVNLDYPSSPTTKEETLRAEADAILDNCVEWGMNAVILQVRPSADALYSSSIFPWSKYLTGAQGRAPDNNFDPLAYWIEGAHQRGLQLHAWLNPYRIAMSTADFNGLTENHPARQHPEWVKKYEDRYYFDPGIPAARNLILQGVQEIVDNYTVDGIHLDDYFYPAQDFDDADSFAAYNHGNYESIFDWRRDNNDLLIRDMYNIVHAEGKPIVFGVSPAGIWANASSHPLGSATRGNQTYYVACADTYKWVKQGWLDYICPQIYWYIGYEIADYSVLAKWWANVVDGTDVALYIGMADYRIGGENVWASINAVTDGMDLNRTIPQITGEVHFRYESIADSAELQAYYRKNYANYGGAKPTLNTADHDGYMQGDNGSFCPDDKLTRAESSTLFTRLIVDQNGNKLYVPEITYQTSFRDVTSSAWYGNAVGFMYQYGLVDGYSNKTFQPNQQITRAEFVTMISRFTTVDKSAPDSFRDVEKHWAREAINSAAAQGLIEGYKDNTFRPDDSISRAEAVTMLNRILGREADRKAIDTMATSPYKDVAKGHWAYYDILEASITHGYTIENGTEAWQ